MPDQATETDLNYLRELAESGQRAPLLGGRFLAWWGALVTLAYAGHFAILSGAGGVGLTALGWMWAAFMVLGVGGQIYMVRSFPASKPGAASMGNQVERVVWQASGYALGAYFLAAIGKSVVQGAADISFAYSLTVVFMAYGVSLITTGVLSESPLLKRAGLGALCMVPLSVWYAGTLYIWLVASLGAALCVLLPGLLMLKAEPGEVA